MWIYLSCVTTCNGHSTTFMFRRVKYPAEATSQHSHENGQLNSIPASNKGKELKRRAKKDRKGSNRGKDEEK